MRCSKGSILRFSQCFFKWCYNEPRGHPAYLHFTGLRDYLTLHCFLWFRLLVAGIHMPQTRWKKRAAIVTCSVSRLSQSIGSSVRFRLPHIHCGNSTVYPHCWDSAVDVWPHVTKGQCETSHFTKGQCEINQSSLLDLTLYYRTVWD